MPYYLRLNCAAGHAMRCHIHRRLLHHMRFGSSASWQLSADYLGGRRRCDPIPDDRVRPVITEVACPGWGDCFVTHVGTVTMSIQVRVTSLGRSSLQAITASDSGFISVCGAGDASLSVERAFL